MKVFNNYQAPVITVKMIQVKTTGSKGTYEILSIFIPSPECQAAVLDVCYHGDVLAVQTFSYVPRSITTEI